MSDLDALARLAAASYQVGADQRAGLVVALAYASMTDQQRARFAERVREYREASK